MKKILVLMPGYHQIVHEFCLHLKKRHYDVELVIPKENINIADKSLKISYFKHSFKLFGSIVFPLDLFKLLKDRSPDIIISGEDFQPISILSSFYVKKNNVAFYIINEKYFLSRFFILKILHKLLIKFVLPFVWKRPEKIIAHSKEVLKFMQKNKVPRNKSIYIPVGVNTERFYPKEFSNQNDILHILNVSRLIYHKGLETFLEALTILKQQGVKFKATIIGDGPLYTKLIRLINFLNLTSEVVIVRKVLYDQMNEFYNSCDIFVLSSVIEVVGVSVLEAMACGKPVVVTDVGGLKDLVINNENGFIAKANDAQDLSNQIMKLVDVNLRKKFGARSLKIVKEIYSWEKVINKYISLMEGYNEGAYGF